MSKIFQRVILFAVTISIAMMAAAATVPNVLSQLPYTYGLGNFPAYQINQNEAYILNRLEPAPWTIVTASGVAALGGNYAVSTSAAAITMTLPTPPTVASPLYSMKFLDAQNKFNTNNLTISASGVANINGLSGASAVVTAATQGGEVECTWLNSTIGYNCNAR
jgi:hypothetical protein